MGQTLHLNPAGTTSAFCLIWLLPVVTQARQEHHGLITTEISLHIHRQLMGTGDEPRDQASQKKKKNPPCKTQPETV